jgi:hypothetical protein
VIASNAFRCHRQPHPVEQGLLHGRSPLVNVEKVP